MSTRIDSLRTFLHESRLEMFETDLAARGMRCQCSDRQARFALPDGSYAVVAKADSCKIIAGGFSDIDRTSLLRLADVFISHYRRMRVSGADQTLGIASTTESVPPSLSVFKDRSMLAEWSSMCDGAPATGGRGIKNPGNFCYFNAVISALSSIPGYVDEIQRLASVSPEQSVVSRLAATFLALNDLMQPAIDYYGTVIEELALSLVAAKCPIRVTDSHEQDDSGLLLHFLLSAVGTQFMTFDVSNQPNIIEVPLLMPIFPESTPDGDDRIYLEDYLSQVVLAFDAPKLLPVWLRRSAPDGGRKTRKIERACYFPIGIDMAVRTGGEGRTVPYFLRAIILHRGHYASSGHYLTAVPTPDRMKVDSPYPLMWEVRNDAKPKVQRLGSLFRDILTNGTCYLYERGG